MKKEVINIRVSSDFKKDLEMLCDLKGMKLSDLGRNALTEYLDSHIDDNNIDDNSDVGVEYLPTTKEDDLLQSFAFAELIFWLYSRRTTRFMDEPISIYEKHLNLINKMQEHRLFNSDILTEFNKIKKELEERISGLKGDFHQFSFLSRGQQGSFNFDKFERFMNSIYVNSEEGKTYIDLGNGMFLG